MVCIDSDVEAAYKDVKTVRRWFRAAMEKSLGTVEEFQEYLKLRRLFSHSPECVAALDDMMLEKYPNMRRQPLMKTWMKKNSDGEITYDLKGLTEQEAITLCNALERVIEARTMTSTDRDTLIEIVNKMDAIMSFEIF